MIRKKKNNWKSNIFRKKERKKWRITEKWLNILGNERRKKSQRKKEEITWNVTGCFLNKQIIIEI